MLVSLIDTDGYISITQTSGGFIRIQLILSMNMEELDMIKYIQSILKVGRINTYLAINTVGIHYLPNRSTGGSIPTVGSPWFILSN